MFSPPRLVSSLSLSVQPSDAQIWETFPSSVEEGNEPRGRPVSPSDSVPPVEGGVRPGGLDPCWGSSGS